MKFLARRALVPLLVLAAIFVVLRAPMSLATLILPPGISLKNVDGTLWSGRASALGVAGMIVQHDLEWHFVPRAVLSGTLSWAVSGRFGDQRSRLTVVLGPKSAALDQVNVFLPLEPLAALHPKLKAAKFGALLHATSGRLSAQAPVHATVDIEQLFSALVPQSSPLGRYQLLIDATADGKGHWTVSSQPGLLAVTGEGQFDAQRSLLDGRLLLTPSATIPGLSPALSLLPRAGDGYLITL